MDTDDAIGSHTYEIKSYGSLSSSEPNWATTDSTISCTINVLSSCTGSVTLTLNPQIVESGKYVIPSASGLSSCTGKTVYFKRDSCSGIEVSNCVISSGTGCGGSAFISSGLPGEYTYFACIDKNGDGDFID